MKIDASNIERLLLLVVEKYGFKGSIENVIKQAEEVLDRMILTIILGDELLENINLQSALSSVINSGKRAFKGGIRVVNSSRYRGVRLPGFIDTTLSDLISEGVVIEIDSLDENDSCICVGCSPLHEDHIQLKANSWQGGIVPFGQDVNLPNSGNLALAGNLASGMAVAFLFMYKIGIVRKLKQGMGLSLWRPDLDWLNEKAIGPDIHCLPNKYWIVGLGHLGQSVQWVLSQFPKNTNDGVEITLQDFDQVNRANFSAGLLSEKDLFGKKKTRVSSDFLERHGYQTRIIERAFDKTVKFSPEDDPSIVVCGVDSAMARKNMDQKHFPMFMDSGLGGSMATFDSMAIYNFMFKELDENMFQEEETNFFHKVINDIEEERYECGVLSRKAISSSFIGLINASIILSEVVRSFNQGMAYEVIDFSFREPDDLIAIKVKEYGYELHKYGYIKID